MPASMMSPKSQVDFKNPHLPANRKILEEYKRELMKEHMKIIAQYHAADSAETSATQVDFKDPNKPATKKALEKTQQEMIEEDMWIIAQHRAVDEILMEKQQEEKLRQEISQEEQALSESREEWAAIENEIAATRTELELDNSDEAKSKIVAVLDSLAQQKTNLEFYIQTIQTQIANAQSAVTQSEQEVVKINAQWVENKQTADAAFLNQLSDHFDKAAVAKVLDEARDPSVHERLQRLKHADIMQATQDAGPAGARKVAETEVNGQNSIDEMKLLFEFAGQKGIKWSEVIRKYKADFQAFAAVRKDNLDNQVTTIQGLHSQIQTLNENNKLLNNSKGMLQHAQGTLSTVVNAIGRLNNTETAHGPDKPTGRTSGGKSR